MQDNGFSNGGGVVGGCTEVVKGLSGEGAAVYGKAPAAVGHQ
jgi:hypothetical protein